MTPEMVFDTLALDGTDVTLHPVYDPVLHVFCVRVRRDGVIYPIGMGDSLQYADQVLAVIDDELARLGIRPLTGEESVYLYAGLVEAKGGPDWAIVRQEIERVDAL
ncbi:hypothetical protein [Streptomyces hydrogenans]|uniref:hypothetical protein n=1 Tax=Streptomyces hydrogenans TaxID=1873719 RepID=UPI00341CCA7C